VQIQQQSTMPSHQGDLDSAINLENETNTVERWAQALQHYQRFIMRRQPNKNFDNLVLKVVIDISASMDGPKMTATKLGLCAIASHLADNDQISLIMFSEHIQPCTPAFITAPDMRRILPQLLARIEPDGFTALFEAINAGVGALRAYAALSNNRNRYVEFVLTDGEDNSSNISMAAAKDLLAHPGFSPFMFILVAVDMEEEESRELLPLVQMPHCKKLNVGVQTGNTLIRVLQEVLLQRLSREVIQRQTQTVPERPRADVGDQEPGGRSRSPVYSCEEIVRCASGDEESYHSSGSADC